MTLDNIIGITEEEKETFQNFLFVNETLKRTEKDKKKLTEDVKTIFKKYNIEDPIEFDGSTFTVTESTRKTLDKKKLSEFAQKLIELGKNYLVNPSIDIDTDTVYAEVQNGTLEEDFVKNYMSITQVKTLTCK